MDRNNDKGLVNTQLQPADFPPPKSASPRANYPHMGVGLGKEGTLANLDRHALEWIRTSKVQSLWEVGVM